MINLGQLRCFWAVAKAGGVHRASANLHLTPQTLSGQVARLEESLGVPLFDRVGRRLELTETGRLALSYAEEIFQVTSELEDVLRDRPGQARQLFQVGIADVVPKTIAYELLKPALDLPDSLRLVCREDKLTRLLAELAVHQLDLILADAPSPFGMDVKCFSHKLGECGIAFLGAPSLLKKSRASFPQCLNGLPLLLPGQDSVLRQAVLRWLGRHNLRMTVAGEFDDSALMKSFGQAGVGVFPIADVIADEVVQQFHVKKLGETNEITEQFYAISAQRRLTHPAVKAITAEARDHLFTK